MPSLDEFLENPTSYQEPVTNINLSGSVNPNGTVAGRLMGVATQVQQLADEFYENHECLCENGGTNPCLCELEGNIRRVAKFMEGVE